MRVSTDVLERIIGCPIVDLEQDPTRRTAARVPVCKRAKLSRIGSMVQIPLTLVDISTGGVGFTFAGQFSPGERFTLHIAGQNEDCFLIECIVRWWRKTANGRTRIGSEFVRLIESEGASQPLQSALS